MSPALLLPAPVPVPVPSDPTPGPGISEVLHRPTDEVISTLAHELGTPLSAISCAARSIALGPDAVASARAALLIERNARHIAELVADVVACSCRTADRGVRVQARTNLCQTLREAIATCEHEILQRRQVLRVMLPMAPIWVQGDATRLRQAFINLLVNAARYTDDGGRLFVSVEALPDRVCVRFRDTGVGIEADALPRLFDLFYRGDEAMHRCATGHGIGLAVVASVIATHGGVVTVLSPGLGRGSEFCVELPL